jgi:2-methylfumaryl-CoA isomerase
LEGSRFQAREEIASLVRPRVRARSVGEIGPLFEKHGVCWARYQSVSELVAQHPSCSEDNPLFRRIDQPGVGRILAPTIPLGFAEPGRLPPLPAPQLGHDTAAVLREVLGLGDSTIAQLNHQGVIGGPPCT